MSYTCDWCKKSCRTGDAFCSDKCADLSEDESLRLLYNRRSDGFTDHFVDWYDSNYGRNPERCVSGAD